MLLTLEAAAVVAAAEAWPPCGAVRPGGAVRPCAAWRPSTTPSACRTPAGLTVLKRLCRSFGIERCAPASAPAGSRQRELLSFRIHAACALWSPRLLLRAHTTVPHPALWRLPGWELPICPGGRLTVLLATPTAAGALRWPYARFRPALDGADTGVAPSATTQSDLLVELELSQGVQQEGAQLREGTATLPGLPSHSSSGWGGLPPAPGGALQLQPGTHRGGSGGRAVRRQQPQQRQQGQRSGRAGVASASLARHASLPRPRPRLPAGQLFDYMIDPAGSEEEHASLPSRLGPQHSSQSVKDSSVAAARKPAAAATAAAAQTAALEAAAPAAIAVAVPAAPEPPNQAALAGALAQLSWAGPPGRTATSLHLDCMLPARQGRGLHESASLGSEGSSGSPPAAEVPVERQMSMPPAALAAALRGPAAGGEPSWLGGSAGHSGEQALPTAGSAPQLPPYGYLTTSQHLQVSAAHAVCVPQAMVPGLVTALSGVESRVHGALGCNGRPGVR